MLLPSSTDLNYLYQLAYETLYHTPLSELSAALGTGLHDAHIGQAVAVSARCERLGDDRVHPRDLAIRVQYDGTASAQDRPGDPPSVNKVRLLRRGDPPSVDKV